jgi:DNA-binding GntR family transcriptional regulator
MEFHRALVCASGSDWVTAFCDQLFEAIARYRQVSRIGRTREHIDAEHKAITEAALNRDADVAVTLLNAHIEMTGVLGREALAALPQSAEDAVEPVLPDNSQKPRLDPL